MRISSPAGGEAGGHVFAHSFGSNVVPLRAAARILVRLGAACAAAATACADEAAICAEMRAFFDADDATRAAIARRIESDTAYDPARVSSWLHEAAPFPSAEAGRTTIRVREKGRADLNVTLRIPQNYDTARAWPLIYALHGTGGNADEIVGFVERMLGARADEFVIAAPDQYQQVVIRAVTPYTPEHRDALRAIRRHVHVDADRVYCTGYSRGGHASWTLAVVCPDEFAGVMPLAGTLLLPEYESLFADFLPNVAHTHVLCCWGALDTADPQGGRSADGGIAGVNRVLRRTAETLKMPILFEEDPSKAHGGILPTRAALGALLDARRVHAAKELALTFRCVEQGEAYWLRPLAWVNRAWDDKPVNLRFKPGENPDDPQAQRAAMGRAIRQLLGELHGRVEGQQISVTRKNVSAFDVLLTEGMVDWTRPVRLMVSGNKVYEGAVKRDLLLCLTRAAQTFDFDRLVWAGLRYEQGKKVRLLTTQDWR